MLRVDAKDTKAWQAKPSTDGTGLTSPGSEASFCLPHTINNLPLLWALTESHFPKLGSEKLEAQAQAKVFDQIRGMERATINTDGNVSFEDWNANTWLIIRAAV